MDWQLQDYALMSGRHICITATYYLIDVMRMQAPAPAASTQQTTQYAQAAQASTGPQLPPKPAARSATASEYLLCIPYSALYLQLEHPMCTLPNRLHGLATAYGG